MRVLLAVDRFAGTLSAAEAARAVAAGWAARAPGDSLDLLPLADGGSGFLDVLHGTLGGELLAVTVTGPAGPPVPAAVLRHGDCAYVEAGHALDPALLAEGERNPMTATSYGVGELVLAAVATGAARVVVGLGESASNDGGAGALAALGASGAFATFGAQSADRLRMGGGALSGLDAPIDLAPARAALAGVELVVASDTDAPLLGPEGATGGFGAARGADRRMREHLEAALRTWATVTDGGIAVRAGAGAAGGVGFGLLLVGARRVSGAALVAKAVGLASRAGAADLVVTGEAVFDWQSLRGKVVAVVAREAQAAGRPVVVLAGRVDVGRREQASNGVDAAYAVVDHAAGPGMAGPGMAGPGAAGPGAAGLVSLGADGLVSLDAAGLVSAGELTALAARVARTWSH